MENIKAIYSNYSSVIKSIGEDAEQIIISKFSYILEIMNDFIKSLNYHIDQNSELSCDNIKIEDILKINESVLTYCVMDYFTDICRLKEFHNIHNINEIKRVAYEASWILRRKPIQILSDDIRHDNITYANEKFVLSYIMHELMKDELSKKLSSNKYAKLSAFTESLFYHLKYRDCDPKVLELMLLSFKAGIAVAENS